MSTLRKNLSKNLFDNYRKDFLPRLNESEQVKVSFDFELITIKEVVGWLLISLQILLRNPTSLPSRLNQIRLISGRVWHRTIHWTKVTAIANLDIFSDSPASEHRKKHWSLDVWRLLLFQNAKEQTITVYGWVRQVIGSFVTVLGWISHNNRLSYVRILLRYY